MKLIGLVGSAGSGKDSFAEEFHYHSYKQLAFADPLKKSCSELFGIPLPSFSDRKLKEIEDPYWKVSPRAIAQFVGTELVREHMHKLLPKVEDNFWVHAMQYRIFVLEQEAKVLGEELKVIITDVRFTNELEFITSLGGHIIHLTRPEFSGNVGIPSHKSELLAAEFRSTYSESTCIHYVDNTGTLEDLKLKAHAIASVLESQ